MVKHHFMKLGISKGNPSQRRVPFLLPESLVADAVSRCVDWIAVLDVNQRQFPVEG